MGVFKRLDDSALRTLTDRQAMFVLEYLQDLNQTRAASDAGYAHPNSMSAKLLANPKVADAIGELIRPRIEKASLTVDTVLQQLHTMLFADPADLVDQSGMLVSDLRRVPSSLRQAIQKLDVNNQYDRGGNIRKQRVIVRLFSKEAALRLAVRYVELTQG